MPHDLVQVLHLEKLPYEQSIGHAGRLHARVSALCGHAEPPNRAVPIVRERFCEPPAHDFVHAVQALQRETLQSAGQLCALHGRVSLPCGHGMPPFSGWRSGRVRDCEPVPHDLVHVVHGANVPTTQWTAQECMLHLRVSARYGHT